MIEKRPVVTLFDSASANGAIARQDDNAGYLTDINFTWWLDLCMKEGAMVWGRRTHEIYAPSMASSLRGPACFVLTSNANFKVGQGWRVATSPAEAVKMAASASARGLVVSGGSSVNTAFVKAGLVDRVIINFEAILVGDGKPMFSPDKFELPLQLRGVERLTETVVQLRYDVI